MRPVEERADYLISVVSKVSGIDERSIRAMRTYPNPWMRGIVLAQLCSEGYTLVQCGHGVGVDHTTALYWRNMVETNVRMGFPSLSQIKDIKLAFDSAIKRDADDVPPDIPGVPHEARVVWNICHSVLSEARAHKHIQEKTYSKITQSITNKITNYYGCKDHEASC